MFGPTRQLCIFRFYILLCQVCKVISKIVFLFLCDQKKRTALRLVTCFHYEHISAGFHHLQAASALETNH
jgi:hypothetical protein